MRVRDVLPFFVALTCAACGSSSTDETTAASSSTTGSSGAGGGGGAEPAGPRSPDPKFLPQVTGTCPPLATGKQTFDPDGKPRDAEVWADNPSGGPIVFWWHGAGGSPKEATAAIGSSVINEVKAQGGLVVGLYHDDAAGLLPWFLSLGGDREDDLRVADEIIACAIRDANLDVRRIYSVGFSAGAMNNMQFSYHRSGYLASIVAYSGSLLGSPEQQDPTNIYPAMLYSGGPDDQVAINFQQGTAAFRDKMVEAGHFAFICDHGKGHTVPSTGLKSSWQFLQDHPFGTNPSPYVSGLPEGFPSYCAL